MSTRIVQLANFYGPESGGLRTTLHHLGAGYRDAGLDPFLIVPGEDDREEETEHGIRISIASPILPGSGGYRAIVSRAHVTDLLRHIAPQHVEVSDKVTLGGVAAWATARRLRPVLLSHERIDGILASRVPRGFPLTAAANRWNRHLATIFSRIVCISRYGAEEFERATTAGNVTAVPLGVDLDLFHPRPRQVSRLGPVRLICVGRLSREKRPDLAIDTLRALIDAGVDANLTMVGGGPLLRELESRAEGLPVLFPGHVTVPDVASLVAAADVAIAPCPVECFGLSVVEALASGTPVVVTDGGAARELVDAECGGVATAHAPSMAAAVIDLLALPAGRRAAAARRRAERYPWSLTVERMLAVHDAGAPLLTLVAP